MNAKTKMLLAIAAAASATPVAAPAAVTLNFSGNICGAAGNQACGDGSVIGQNYGDIAGVIDIGYRAFFTDTGVTTENYLKRWASNYGDLTDIIYGGGDAGRFTSEITFTAAAGYEVALVSLDAGCYRDRGSCQTLNYNIRDGGGSALAVGSTSTDYPGHASLAVNSTYVGSIVLQWGPDGYDVGLDNIMFDVRQISASPVPEPATWAMMIGGFGLVGGAMRRRERLAIA